MGTAVFLVAGAIAFGGGCLARSRYERDCLVTEEYRIVSEKIHAPEKTIVFLTDLHNKEFGDQNCRLLDAVRKVKPDAVLSGGDGMVAMILSITSFISPLMITVHPAAFLLVERFSYMSCITFTLSFMIKHSSYSLLFSEITAVFSYA